MLLSIESMIPYMALLFGSVMTYTAWASKKILENIEASVKSTSNKVSEHEKTIARLESSLLYESLRVTEIKVEVGILRNHGKLYSRLESKENDNA